jgi:hypothetical protein
MCGATRQLRRTDVPHPDPLPTLHPHPLLWRGLSRNEAGEAHSKWLGPRHPDLGEGIRSIASRRSFDSSSFRSGRQKGRGRGWLSGVFGGGELAGGAGLREDGAAGAGAD